MAVNISDTGMVAIIRCNGLYYPVRATSFSVNRNCDGRATIHLEGSIDCVVGYHDPDGVGERELPHAKRCLDATPAGLLERSL